MIKPMSAPPIWAKCATFPMEYLVTPKNRSPKSIMGIKYFAAMGTGKKIKANLAFGKVKQGNQKTRALRKRSAEPP